LFQALARASVSPLPSERADAQGWIAVNLSPSDGLCGAAAAVAQALINTSRSNVKGR
jgi:hypothetical protein